MSRFKIFLFVLAVLIFQIQNRNGIEVQAKKRCKPRKVDYSRDALISIIPNTACDREYLIHLSRKKIVDFWSEDLMVIGRKKLLRIRRLKLKDVIKCFNKRNMKITVVSPNLQRLLNRNLNQLQMNRNHPFNPKNFDFGHYHSFENIELFLTDLTEKHKDISKLENFGTSYEKRPLYAVKISLNIKKKFLKDREDGTRNMVITKTKWKIIVERERREKTLKQIILIDCGIHGREWASISFCIYFINELITGFKGNKKKYKKILTKYDFIIIPVLNPDGYVYSQEKDRFWRKTRSKNNNSWCVGTDANRNFYNPGKCDVKDPCEDNYCGEKPFSEPETASFKSLLEKTAGKLKAYFSIHTFGQYWLTPWAKPAKNKPKHYDKMIEVGKIGVNAIKKRFNTEYTIGMASTVLYPGNGVAVDYVYEKGFANYSFGLELRDKGDCDKSEECGFLLPLYQIVPTCQETTDGIIASVLAME